MVVGGPIGVGDIEAYPWLGNEIAGIRQRLLAHTKPNSGRATRPGREQLRHRGAQQVLVDVIECHQDVPECQILLGDIKP